MTDLDVLVAVAPVLLFVAAALLAAAALLPIRRVTAPSYIEYREASPP